MTFVYQPHSLPAVNGKARSAYGNGLLTGRVPEVLLQGLRTVLAGHGCWMLDARCDRTFITCLSASCFMPHDEYVREKELKTPKAR
jgi:hypothetical protein